MTISLSKMAVLCMGLCIGAGMALASDPLVARIEQDASDAGKGGMSNIIQDVKGTLGISQANVTNAARAVDAATTNVSQRGTTNLPTSRTVSSEAHSAGHAVATNAVSAAEDLLGNMLK